MDWLIVILMLSYPLLIAGVAALFPSSTPYIAGAIVEVAGSSTLLLCKLAYIFFVLDLATLAYAMLAREEG